MQLSFICGLVYVGVACDFFMMLAHASEALDSKYEPVRIFADTAVQEADTRGFVFIGKLRVSTLEWRIDGDGGLLEGGADDVHFVKVQGAPARIQYFGDEKTVVHGVADVVNYSPARKLVKLLGAAKLSKGTQSVQSDEIEYFLNSGTWSAGNTSRVKMIKEVK